MSREARAGFDHAVEVITAARQRDGVLVAQVVNQLVVEELQTALIAAACFARDGFDQWCEVMGYDPDEFWSAYAVSCQQSWDGDR